jgi:hypothetical protein
MNMPLSITDPSSLPPLTVTRTSEGFKATCPAVPELGSETHPTSSVIATALMQKRAADYMQNGMKLPDHSDPKSRT